jgi:hypothetical protein
MQRSWRDDNDSVATTHNAKYLRHIFGYNCTFSFMSPGMLPLAYEEEILALQVLFPGLTASNFAECTFIVVEKPSSLADLDTIEG